MHHYFISAINPNTGEITELRGKAICISLPADSKVPDYIHCTREYIDRYGMHKDDIEIYPHMNFVTVKESTLVDKQFKLTTGIPEIYQIDELYEQIM